jgi:hypothetical protein
MSQSSHSVGNVSAPAFRDAMNTSLQALATLNSGATAPTVTYANMIWCDTDANILKMRSEADGSVWINVAYVDQSANAWRVLDDTQVVNTSGTQTGLIGDQSTATWEAGTGTTESLVSPAKVKAAIDASTLPGILAIGTAAAGELAGATWTTIPINSLPINSITGASLSASNITLPAGTYYVKWVHPFGYSGSGAAILGTRVYNVTDSSVALAGQDGVQIGENYSGVQVHGMGVFILGSSKSISVQGYASNGAVTALKGLYLEIYKTA